MTDSKEEISEGAGAKEESQLVEKVMEFCMASSFEKEFETFAKMHSSTFKMALELPENAEHPLTWHQV